MVKQADIADQIVEELDSSQWMHAGELAEIFGVPTADVQTALETLEKRGRVECHKCWPGEDEWSIAAERA